MTDVPDGGFVPLALVFAAFETSPQAGQFFLQLPWSCPPAQLTVGNQAFPDRVRSNIGQI